MTEISFTAADAFLYLRIGFGTFAVLIMAWVTYGFRHGITPRVVWHGMKHMKQASVSENLRASVTLFHIKGIGRLGFWDVLQPMFFLYVADLAWSPPAYVSAVNLIFQALAISASIPALAALYKSIPLDKRQHYSWLTAPLFPFRRYEQMEHSAQRATEDVGDAVLRERHATKNQRQVSLALARAVLADPVRAVELAHIILEEDE